MRSISMQCLKILIPLTNLHNNNNDDGLSPLHVAVMKDFVDGVGLLLQVSAASEFQIQKVPFSLLTLTFLFATEGNVLLGD